MFRWTMTPRQKKIRASAVCYSRRHAARVIKQSQYAHEGKYDQTYSWGWRSLSIANRRRKQNTIIKSHADPTVNSMKLSIRTGTMNSIQNYPSISQHTCSLTNSSLEERLDCIANALQANDNSLARGMNAFFVVFGAVLVFMMQAGFAMICAGCVREKNIQNTMLKNLLDLCGAALAFWAMGYAIAYGTDNSFGTTFIGTTNFLLYNLKDYAFWFFEFAFAATTTTIVAGALAERSQMGAYFMYSILLTAFVYPVVAHALWSSHGFLSPRNPHALLGSGAIDFAGGGVVHLTGGICAFIAVWILGPRRGRFYDSTGKVIENPTRVKGSSISFQLLGTFLLWFGWYGFNCGSALIVDNEKASDVVSLIAVNTTLGGAAGCVSALFLSVFVSERTTGEYVFDVIYAMNGTLTGLVSITAGCAVVEPWAAVFIGFVGGILHTASSKLLVRYKIDDAVDAIPVHLPGGAWAVLSVGLFASSGRVMDAYGQSKHIGWFYSFERSADATLLACQVIEILFIVGWVSIIMTPFFVVLNYFGYFRSDALDEVVGLDVSYHEADTAKTYRDQKQIMEGSVHSRGSMRSRGSNSLHSMRLHSIHNEGALNIHDSYNSDGRAQQEMYRESLGV